MESRPARGEWIEIYSGYSSSTYLRSRPARGEWIEMRMKTVHAATVSPREGRVD